MLKVTKYRDATRENTWRLRWTVNGKRSGVVWRGDETAAEIARGHVEHLLECNAKKQLPHRLTIEWTASLSMADHSKLERVGLCDPRPEATPVRTIHDLYQSFLAANATNKDSTKATYRQAWRVLEMRFGADRPVDSITELDALKFRQWLQTAGNLREGLRQQKEGEPKPKTSLDRNTVGRRTGICRQIFKHGIKLKWIQANPFEGLPATVSANPERFHYVPAEDFERIIDFAPNAGMRAVIALNRLIGLRIPSEIVTLKWSDIDLSDTDGHIRLKAPKTEHHHRRGIRTAPLLPTLRPFIEDLWTLAEPGLKTPISDPVFPRFVGTSDAAPRSAMLKILKRAGIEPWPNLFSNGRKSAITDLLIDGHSVADVASWVGNSPKVIWDFYAMATEGGRRRAASGGLASLSESIRTATNGQSCGPPCGPNQGESGAVSPPQTNQETRKNGVDDDPSGSLTGDLWAMRDSNPRHSRCKRDALAN